MRKYILTLLALIACWSLTLSAQDLNIQGAVIKVSSQTSPILMFPDEVTSVFMSCDHLYTPQPTKTRVKLKAISDHPGPCNLLVEEGKGDKLRSHMFIIRFVESSEELEGVYDFSTKEKIKETIDMLRKQPKSERPKTNGEKTAGGTATVEQELEADPRAGEDSIGRYLNQIPDKKKEELLETKINYFFAFCNKIGDKTKDVDVAHYLERTRTELYGGRTDYVVETISKKQGRKSYPVLDYMRRIRNLPYAVSKFKAKSFQFGKIYKGEDGDYYMSVKVLQVFEGANREGVRYVDNTTKIFTARMVVNPVLDPKTGKTTIEWDIFLGDIKAETLD